ncbi:MAG: hypothetical protein JJU32_01350 [Phormidium sp. BM_Day4_Bin.17]|nr:hypothetical protein [Phormidium sp. BM_Day4_Bin.17]UCJ12422.1 MAG: hypothetical protein JWS08_00910 [Phormidium sp. PBR-2020]
MDQANNPPGGCSEATHNEVPDSLLNLSQKRDEAEVTVGKLKKQSSKSRN